MKKSRLLSAVCAILFAFMSVSANAALISRLGGLAYYDDVADLTWLADANAGAGSAFDDGNSTTDGFMTWLNANNWAASLSVGGVGGWRLPDTAQPDSSCSGDHPGGDFGPQGFGLNCTGSEMGNLFYNVLGGEANKNITTTHTANYDLFSNVLTTYWSATEYAPWSPTHAWRFSMNGGGQDEANKGIDFYAWAVQSGDVGAVPIPPAVWLFGSGLLGLIGMARRKKAA